MSSELKVGASKLAKMHYLQELLMLARLLQYLLATYSKSF